jgi:hypothetical protein
MKGIGGDLFIAPVALLAITIALDETIGRAAALFVFACR